MASADREWNFSLGEVGDPASTLSGSSSHSEILISYRQAPSWTTNPDSPSHEVMGAADSRSIAFSQIERCSYLTAEERDLCPPHNVVFAAHTSVDLRLAESVAPGQESVDTPRPLSLGAPGPRKSVHLDSSLLGEFSFIQNVPWGRKAYKGSWALQEGLEESWEHGDGLGDQCCESHRCFCG